MTGFKPNRRSTIRVIIVPSMIPHTPPNRMSMVCWGVSSFMIWATSHFSAKATGERRRSMSKGRIMPLNMAAMQIEGKGAEHAA